MDKSFQETYAECLDLFDPNSASFCQRIFETDSSVYASRLRCIGFRGLGHVLDAGCGFGQWTRVLADLNDRVSAVDVDEVRLTFLRKLLENDGLSADIRENKISALSFEDAVFDGVFSYSVVFIDDWKKSLAEFARVLKPGGLLYFNFNEVGWYLNLWKNRPNAAPNYDPREAAVEAFANTLLYEKNPEATQPGSKIIEEQVCVEHLEQLGFGDIRCGGDGTIGVAPGEPVSSFFPLDYDGLPGVREILCVKQ